MPSNHLRLSFSLSHLAVCLSLTGAPVFAAAAFEKAPVDDILVPLPQGQQLAFRIIPLGIGGEPFAGKEFFVGGRGAEGFKETPTHVRSSGTAVLDYQGKPDWCLFFGKHEVTQAQWAAALGEPKPDARSADLPVVSISRAQVAAFIEKANQLLYQSGTALAELKSLTKSPRIFFRLPDEAEWEFVARGGNAVDSGQFDKSTPYADALNKHEWYAGSESSNGRIRPVGKLSPNPLGVHDMLGNAAEFVENLYHIEYLQGRSGGVTRRGGDFLTPEKELRSSLRKEVPACQANGEPYRTDTTGFRLVIGSAVIPDIATANDLEIAWNDYAKTRIAVQPSLPANASLQQQTAVEIADIGKLLDEIVGTKKISQTGGETLDAKFNLLRPQIESLQARIEAGERYYATGAVKLASIASLLSLDYTKRIRAYAENEDAVVQLAIQKLTKNIARARETMRESCVMLGQINPDIVSRAFDLRIDELQGLAKAENESGYDAQARCTQIAKEMAMAYVNHRRLDFDSWLRGLEKVAIADATNSK